MPIIKQNIQIKACRGEGTIAKAKDLFTGWIDSDFVNYGTDKHSDPATSSMEVATLEVEKDGTFKEIFGSVSTDFDSLCLTQEQIIAYVESNRDLLTDWYTFFLFRVGSEFFVAGVYVNGGGGLTAHVYRLSRGGVWDAGNRLRFVLPQLALEKQNVTLSPSETLNLPKNDAMYIKSLEARIELLEDKWESTFK